VAARQLAIKVAATDAPVLLTGETGTGKEVFAQAIHHSSRRNQQPFIAINCSALSKDLLESELFGHLAGAFTGASKDKKGLVEAADKGTLFLDEIGEMPAELQAKLLRVLESQTFTKVGDTQTRKVDIRIIAATHRNLQQESQAGRFREDLYFRLSVMEIHLPSLNERRDDIPALAQYYLNSFNSKLNKNITGISEACMDALTHHHWRGNIRELRNVIERAMILCDGNLLDKTDLPYDFQEMPAAAPTTSAKLADIERQHILRTLEATGGNKTEAARLLDIGLATLYRKLEIYGVH
jgi:two-component system NtrC family response regulator